MGDLFKVLHGVPKGTTTRVCNDAGGSGGRGDQRRHRECYFDDYDGIGTAAGGFLSRIPALFSPHPDDDTLELVDYDYSTSDGKRVRIELSYERPPGVTIPTDPLPRSICDSSESSIEVDIRRHPDFSTASATLGGKSLEELWDHQAQRVGAGAPSPFAGMSHYVVGSFTVVCTDYFRGDPPSIQGLVGTRAVPSGFSGGLDHWLILSGSTSEPGDRGDFGSRTLFYQYSELEWPDGIYG